jgi:hypothetical protein
MADPEEKQEGGNAPVEGMVPGEEKGPADAEGAGPTPGVPAGGTAEEPDIPAEAGARGEAPSGTAGEPGVPSGISGAGGSPEGPAAAAAPVGPPPETEKYRKFKKVDGATYQKVNKFLRKHTYVTAREWAIARLCADFKTTGGSEMTYIGEHLPELVPFMTDPYSPQAVNQARSAFKKKVKKAGATFFYGAMCGFFTADELDDILFESSEVARFLLEVEGTTLDVDQEIDVEDRITDIMRNVAESAARILRERPGREEEEEG